MAEEKKSEYPFPVYGAFRFRVYIDNSDQAVNQAFTKVSGVQSESETMEYMQGTDAYVNTAPGRPKFADVELQRVYNGIDSFYKWRRAIERGEIVRRTVTIELLDVQNRFVRAMSCIDAWPKAWYMPEMDSQTSSPAMERIVLSVSEVAELTEDEFNTAVGAEGA